MNYEILKSGSSGNCVIVEDMMFDCGIPFREIRKKLYKIKFLLLTHRHSDHINKTTLNRIRKEFPRIQIIGNYDIAERFYVNTIIGDESVLYFKDRVIKSFPCVHDVICHGFVVETENNSLIYATDTHSLEHAPKGKYDYLFIESNHDENKIKQIQNNSKNLYGYDAWENAVRHLSTQKSKAFYYLNRKSKDSEWVELHKSERFY